MVATATQRRGYELAEGEATVARLARELGCSTATVRYRAAAHRIPVHLELVDRLWQMVVEARPIRELFRQQPVGYHRRLLRYRRSRPERVMWTRCPCCNELCRLLPLARAGGYRLADADGVAHAIACPRLAEYVERIEAATAQVQAERQAIRRRNAVR